MTRHPALEPFSRDHNDGLILARKALKLAEAEPRQRIAARGELEEAWERDLQSHFDSEELLLAEIATPEERARLHSEHRELEAHFGAVREGDSSAERFKRWGRPSPAIYGGRNASCSSRSRRGGPKSNSQDSPRRPKNTNGAGGSTIPSGGAWSNGDYAGSIWPFRSATRRSL
ncbi:MAG: hypothetical protein UZ18_ATM001002132 [Armatimonadetes bacterium OLB18]|nr:MAG: hypothetical protein UZ18_ATM001002132 [Armatimonadetes bacterium OLB18]